jgi:uncharacterized small protein (DUF1192 family)
MERASKEATPGVRWPSEELVREKLGRAVELDPVIASLLDEIRTLRAELRKLKE